MIAHICVFGIAGIITYYFLKTDLNLNKDELFKHVTGVIIYSTNNPNKA